MCVLAFLSDGNRVPKANILLYPLVLLWPSQPGRHAQYQSFAFEHHCLAPRAMVGNLSKDKHLSQAWKRSTQDVFIFFASLPPWPPLQPLKKQVQVTNCPSAGWGGTGHCHMSTPSEGRWLPLLVDLPPPAHLGTHLHEDQGPQPPVFCPWKLIWQAQSDSSACNQHAPGEKQTKK